MSGGFNLTLADMQTTMRTTMDRDPDVSAYLKRMVDVLGKLSKEKYEQVLWVTDLNRWYDMVLHPLSNQVQPAVEMVESGRAGHRFLTHVNEVVYWMNRRMLEKDPNTVQMSLDVGLDRIDTISNWLVKNGLKGLYAPIREMRDEANKRLAASIEVAKRM